MLLKRIIKDILTLMPRSKGASILMYHSVERNDAIPLLAVKPEIFQKQMKYLKDNSYQVIKLSDLVNLLKGGKELPEKTVVLTFDDGFKDNYSNAFPVLKEYNLPATIFLTVGWVGKEVVTSHGAFPALNWNEIEEMHSSDLIDFQPHTITHPKLDQITLGEIESEIIQSKKIIEEKLNKECRFFAPPKGRISQEVKEILENEGFEAVLTIERGFIKKGDNLFELKRQSINSIVSFIQFKSKV